VLLSINELDTEEPGYDKPSIKIQPILKYTPGQKKSKEPIPFVRKIRD
jgi:hypothetical protein